MRRTRIERAATWQCLSLASIVQFASSHAAAQPADARAEARTHFDQGVGFSRKHEYAEALSEFERAYQIFPHFSVQYNIGQALTALGRPTEAIAALTRYLEEGGANVEANRRKEVETTIAGELAKTSSVEITVDVPNALVSIDDKPSGRSPLAAPIRVDSGTHRVLATLDSGERSEINVDAKVGQAARVNLQLTAPIAPVASPVASPGPAPPSVAAPPSFAVQSAPPAPATHHSTQRTVAYIVGATGIALSGATAAHFLWNRARYQDWQSRYNAYYQDPTDQNRDSANNLAQSVSNASAVTVGLAIGAGVALGTGAILLITSSSSVTAAGNVGAGGPFMTVRGEF